MEINRDNIFDILKQTNISPDKDYGQNFLLDSKACQLFVDTLNIYEQDYVLEIGPGLGSLTHFLSLKNAKTTIVDIDNRMTSFLKIVYRDNSNIEIINKDVRAVDLSKFTKIIGNLPYNITTELVNHILVYAKNATTITLMCQKEAFDRFNDLSGKKYGPSSILIHLLGTCAKVKTVPAGSFYPAPKCDSVVFTININEANREEAVNIYKFSILLFSNRRKTILNNLVNAIHDKDKAIQVLNSLNIPINKRPEELSVETFKNLYLTCSKI